MRLRSLAMLAAAGLFVAPALAQQPTPPSAPVAPPRAVAPPKPCDVAYPGDIPVLSPRTVAPPKPCDAVCPAMTLPSPRYLEHPPEYSPEASDVRRARDEFHRHWINNPSLAPIYERTVVKTYAVADLVVPPPPVGCCVFATDTVKTCERELIKKITTAIEPKSWSCAGGTGSIEFYPLGMALVINHTPEVQAAVARYLDSLRKLQDLQVVVEVLVATASDGWFQSIGLAKQFSACDGNCVQHATGSIQMPADAIERLFRSAKDAGGMSALARPTIHTLNGQSGQLKVGQAERFVTGYTVKSVSGNVVYIPKSEDHEMGIRLRVEPTVAADGKVRMVVAGSVCEHAVLPVPMTPLTTVVQPVPEKGKSCESVPFTQFIQEPKIITRTVADTVEVPDGGSVLIYGGKGTVEETIKERLPTLSDVPVLADLFAKDKKTTTTNHLLVVMTAHVVRPESGVEQCAACCSAEGKLARLMAEYKRACREGKSDEARRLAIECLALDATCFGAK